MRDAGMELRKNEFSKKLFCWARRRIMERFGVRVRSKEIEMKVKAEGIVELFYFISTDFSYQTENLPDVYSLMMMKTWRPCWFFVISIRMSEIKGRCLIKRKKKKTMAQFIFWISLKYARIMIMFIHRMHILYVYIYLMNVAGGLVGWLVCWLRWLVLASVLSVVFL